MSVGDTTHEQRHAAAAELLEGYALDALDPEESAVVDAHRQDDCEGCERALAAFRGIASALALATPLVAPAAKLKQRVLAQAVPPARPVGSSRPGILAALRRPSGMAAMAASFSVAALIGLATWNAVLHDRVGELEDENSSLAAPPRAVEPAVAEGAASAAQSAPAAGAVADPPAAAEALLSLSEPETQIVPLRHTEVAPAAQARMIWDPQEQFYTLVADGLEPTLMGAVYVVWMETADGVQRVGHFYVDESGRGFMRQYLEIRLDEATSLLVTLEPDVEVSQRTADPVLLLDR